MNSKNLAMVALAASAFCTLASAQTFSYDNGTTENALNLPGAVEMGFMHGFDSGATGDSIRTVSVAIGTALAPAGGLDGRMVRVADWDDPNNDGDPADAVLLSVTAPFAATGTNSDVKVPTTLPAPVPVAGIFFVGALVEAVPGEFPVGVDQDSVAPGALAYLFGGATSIDPANPGGGSIGLIRRSSEVFLLDAIGGGAFLSTNYCMANPNTSGLAGTMSGVGTTVASANNVTLTASNLPVNQFGFMICSLDQGFVVMTGGNSNGNLCLGGVIGRLSMPNQILNSGMAGQFSLTLDLTAIPQGNTTVSISAGETWNFQAWFRDPVGLGSNFTDGIEISFQ